MASEDPVPLGDDVNSAKEKPVIRSSRRKNKPGKVPKKIHKAEREKLKRDHLNVLFLKLGNALEPTHQNNGKASLLTNATRLLRDLLAQVDCLKRANTDLLSESHYVTAEKHELREENSALQVQIEDMISEVQKRMLFKSSWKLDQSEPRRDPASQLQEDHSSQPAPVLGPLLVVPLHHRDLPVYCESDTADSVPKIPSNVSRPHPRYPSPSDCWPSQILPKQSETNQSAQPSSSSINNGEG